MNSALFVVVLITGLALVVSTAPQALLSVEL